MAIQTWHDRDGQNSDRVLSVKFGRSGYSAGENALNGANVGAFPWKRKRNQRSDTPLSAICNGASRQGSGVYEIHVNNRGTVSEVKILKSSGDPIFDQATVNALRQWKLRSGPKIIELPLAFRLTPDSYSVRIP